MLKMLEETEEQNLEALGEIKSILQVRANALHEFGRDRVDATEFLTDLHALSESAMRDIDVLEQHRDVTEEEGVEDGADKQHENDEGALNGGGPAHIAEARRADRDDRPVQRYNVGIKHLEVLVFEGIDPTARRV